MMPQINFTISKECEKRLFSFISSECKCTILLTESLTGDFIYTNDYGIDYDKYLITPLPANFKFRTEKRQSNYSSSEVLVIYPFDENGYFIPVMEYERDLFSDSPEIPCRLFLRSSSISPQFQKEMKSLFDRMKKWVKDNSRRKATIGKLSFYEVK